MDIGYLEACCFMDYLKESGAVSEETAVPLADRGNRRMNRFAVIMADATD